MGKLESSDLDIKVYSPRKSFVVAILWDGTYKGFEALQRVVKGLKGDIFYTGPRPKNYSLEGLPVPALPQRLSVEVNGAYAGILPGQFVILRHKYGPIILDKEEFELVKDEDGIFEKFSEKQFLRMMTLNDSM